MMKRIISCPASVLVWLSYGLLLCLFHPVQVICHYTGGYSLRKKSVDILNLGLLYSLSFNGCRIRFTGLKKIPHGRPLIIISNHQSFFDIPPVIWAFRRFHPKFVSKKELGKGIPSVSYNLRHGGSALIDRKNPRQSIIEISKLGKHIEETGYSASIFPEGTRSKTGKLKTFQSAGLAALLKKSPSALIVPFVLDGHDRLMKKGYFPLTFGVRLNYCALEAIDPNGRDAESLTIEVKDKIQKKLDELRQGDS